MKLNNLEHCQECSICLETDDKPTQTLSCNHTFHKKCISKWLKNSDSCPMCRSYTKKYYKAKEKILNFGYITINRNIKIYVSNNIVTVINKYILFKSKPKILDMNRIKSIKMDNNYFIINYYNKRPIDFTYKIDSSQNTISIFNKFQRIFKENILKLCPERISFI